ncbi:MAG: hypothetical protein ABS95_02755 [Verrucomicrobia bacterium SCN 57-15]|nr:MAG: hypothetical protein ABS95_02755 [Verrucomicrobia bacterium SCN 57-15]
MLGLAAMTALLAGCTTYVKPGQAGLRYRSFHRPALQQTAKSEGLYWRWPWNDVKIYDVTWQSKSERVDILTADDLHVQTTVTVTFRPNPARLYDLATELGPAYYEQVIRPPFQTISRSEFAKHQHNQLAKDSAAIENDILAKLRATTEGKPIEIDRVSIDHIQYDPSVTAAISAKIATEQQVQQKELEVKVAAQDAEIARTRAQGQSDAVRINAEGEAKAIVIKGEAQGKAQASINQTLTPEYIRYKAFDSQGTRYYFVPVGKDGLPLIINATDRESAVR